MAIIKCPECGKDISDRAENCPNCGCPMEEIKRSIGEIEAEKAAKQKEKEEERRAKELAAEIKKRKQEEARKSVTPEMKRKRVIIVAVVAVLLIFVSVIGWYYGIKIPREQAYEAYIEAVDLRATAEEQYNEAVNIYNEKAKAVIKANDGLDKIMKEAQALIDSGDEAYEGSKITTLSNTIKDARNNKIETPDLKQTVSTTDFRSTMESESKGQIESATQEIETQTEKYLSDIKAVETAEKALEIPDYTQVMSTIEIQSKELEDSYAIQRQIIQPTEEWVIKRLGRIKDVATIAPVTEEHDPNGHLNKDGGYTATVYFMTPLLGTENLSGYDAIEEGTDGGGAVEVYRTVDDAESRNDYLGALDGGIFASGSHVVLGTMVLRTSDELKASQQETLTNSMIKAMTALD